jgi:CRISPR-associated endonuclease/helicase Cas3
MDDGRSAIAHVREDGETHDLEDHLRAVAARASQFADAFGAGDWAHLAGIRHDLGKYQAAFQRYIRAAGGLDAHIEGARGRVDHSTVGALGALETADHGIPLRKEASRHVQSRTLLQS